MRKLLVVSFIALTLAPLTGCNSCGRPFSRWFNRGDSCETCVDTNHCPPGQPGLLGSPVLSAPYGGESLPGPATILPAPRQ